MTYLIVFMLGFFAAVALNTYWPAYWKAIVAGFAIAASFAVTSWETISAFISNLTG